MAPEAPKENRDRLVPLTELRKSVDELRRTSGVPALQNDPRLAGPSAVGNHPLSKYFRLDALAPTSDPSRSSNNPPPLQRPELKDLRQKTLDAAKKPDATWDEQMSAVVMEYYFTRERLPNGQPKQKTIEAGANMHITRLLTNTYGVSEFITTYDLYVKFLESHPDADSLRDPTIEASLMKDAKNLSALMPYWGRVTQVYFNKIQGNAAGEAEARRLLQQARQAIPPELAAGIPPDVSALDVNKLLETTSPIEGQLRNIIFSQSDAINPPRYNPSVIEKMVASVTDKVDQDKLRAELARIGMTEPKVGLIRGRRVHVAYINLLNGYRVKEADKVIEKAAGGKIPPENVGKLMVEHHKVGQEIMKEHRFGFQTTTAHMFAGTLGVAGSLQEDPANRLEPLKEGEVQQSPFQNYLSVLEKSARDPAMQQSLREQRVKSAEAVRNYTGYMRQEALTLRTSLRLTDAVYIQPAIQDIANAIQYVSDLISGKIAWGANWVLYGPMLATMFPSLADKGIMGVAFETDPNGARKKLIELKQEAEKEQAKLQSLHATIEQTQKDLEQYQKEMEPHLKVIETMAADDVVDPERLKKAKEAVDAIAGIEQKIAESIDKAWANIEVNMQHHAETAAILGSAQDSLLKAYAAIGAVFVHAGWNAYMSSGNTGAFVRTKFWAKFSTRMASGGLAEIYDITNAARRVVTGGAREESTLLRSMNSTEAVARHAEVMSRAARVRMAEGALKFGGLDVARLSNAERQALQNAIWNAHEIPKTGPGGTWAIADLRAKMRILTTEGKLTQAQARLLIEAGYCGPCNANTIAANLRAMGLPQIAEETTMIGRMATAAEALKGGVPEAANVVRPAARTLEVGGEQGMRLAKSISPEAKAGLSAMETAGKGLRWGRVIPVAAVGLDAFIVYDNYNKMQDAKEYVGTLQNELRDMLPKSGFNKVEEGVYERDGVRVRVADLTKFTEQQVEIARQRVQSSVAVGLTGTAILFADTGVGIPLALALAAGAATIEINQNVDERSKMVSFIENADPWILAYMGTAPLTKVNEQDFLITDLFKWGVTDLFVEKSPEFQKKVAFSMFMSYLKTRPTQLAEIVGTDFSPSTLNEFYNTDFKNIVYPSITTFLFTGMKNSTAPWTDIRDFKLQAGSLDRKYADENDVKGSMGEATTFYVQHLREKRYLFYRRNLQNCFLEAQQLESSSDPADKSKAKVLMEQAQALDLIVQSLGGQVVFGKMLSEVDAELENGGDKTRAERYLSRLRTKIEGSLDGGKRAESFYEYIDQPSRTPGTREDRHEIQEGFAGKRRTIQTVYPKVRYAVTSKDVGEQYNNPAFPELVMGQGQNLSSLASGGFETLRQLDNNGSHSVSLFASKFPSNVRSVFIRACNQLSDPELRALSDNVLAGMYPEDAQNLQRFLTTVGPDAITGFVELFANVDRQTSFKTVKKLNEMTNVQCARCLAEFSHSSSVIRRGDEKTKHILDILSGIQHINFDTPSQSDARSTRSVLGVLQARKSAAEFRQKFESGNERDRLDLLEQTASTNWKGLAPEGDSRNREGPFGALRVTDRLADPQNPIFEFEYAGDVIDASFLGINSQFARPVAVNVQTLSNGMNPPLQKNFEVTQFSATDGKKLRTFSIDWQFRSSQSLSEAEKQARMRILTSPTGSEARMEPVQRILDLFPHQVVHQQKVENGNTYNDFSKPSTLYYIELQKKLKPLYRSAPDKRVFLEDLFLQLEAAGGITEKSSVDVPAFIEKKQQKLREEELQKRLDGTIEMFSGYESAEDATSAILRVEEKDGKKFWVIDYTPSDAAMAPFMERGLRKCFDGQYMPRLVSIDSSNQRNIRLRLEDIPTPTAEKEYWPSGQFQQLKLNFKKFERGEYAERIPGKDLELMLHRGILTVLKDEGADMKLDPSTAKSEDITKAIAGLRLPWFSTENDNLTVDGKVVIRGWTSLLVEKPNEALSMLALVHVPYDARNQSEQSRKFETLQWRLRNLFSGTSLYLQPNLGEGNELNHRRNEKREEPMKMDIQNELNSFGLNGGITVPPSAKIEVGGKELLVGRTVQVDGGSYTRLMDSVSINVSSPKISITVDGKEYTKK